MSKKPNQENPFVNIMVNIFLPVMILNNAEKIDHPQSALIALAAALALPIGYGLWDYLKNGRRNLIALLGIVNVSFTGGFAIMQLSGTWFAVKEAFFPLILGIGVLGSQYFGKPIFVAMIKNSGALNWSLLEKAAESKGNLDKLYRRLRNCNLYFASSFFLSSLLNLVLALMIFVPIDPALSDTVKQQVLNEQIGEMTWKGYVVIALPLMVFMGFIFWYFLNGVKTLTGLQFEDLAGESETKVPS